MVSARGVPILSTGTGWDDPPAAAGHHGNMRRLLPLLFLLSVSAFADPILSGFAPGPLFEPQGGIVTIDLGDGLIWQGPEMPQEEWDQRMGSLPMPQPFNPLGAPIIEPGILLFQSADPPAADTPEPATAAMIPLGLLAAALLLRSRALRR